jgi:hypothetical protein
MQIERPIWILRAACHRPTRARAALAAGGAFLAAVAGMLLPRDVGADTPSRPTLELPSFRRVFLSPEGAPGALGEGVLRKLPRADFEEKVRRARQALEGLRNPPQLTEARYRARLVDKSLVGTGQWKVIQAGVGRGLLPLQPLNVALREPRFENRDALIADFDGKEPALLVDSAGDHAVAIEWSARGEERPDELVFDLKLPACPVAVLELDLPADRAAITTDGSLTSGPYEAESPDRRLWRIGCGGRPGAEIRVRRTGAAARPTLILARQYTTQLLEPEGLEATYQFDLEILHREVSSLVLECDPVLRPYEVTIPGLGGWELHPPDKPDAPARLEIKLSEPLQAGRQTLSLRCLAPLGDSPASSGPAPIDWRSPDVHLAGAISRGETLVMLVSADLRLDRLKSGDFQLTGNTNDPASTRRGPAQRFTFTGGSVATRESMPRRPFMRLRPFAVEYRARQLAWWQPGAEPPAITLQIGYDVERGRLFQLPVLLPIGWDVERVDMSPSGLLRNWSVQPTPPEAVPADSPGGADDRQCLLVDLQRPLTPVPRDRADNNLPGVSAFFGRPRAPTLTVRLVPKAPAPPGGGEVLFPDATPLGARFREGVLAIGLDSQVYQATLNGPATEADLEEDGPWGRQVPDAAYQYRGRPVEGSLILAPRPAQVKARCVSDVYLPAGRAAVNTRLVLEAESGRPDSVVVALSAPANPVPESAHPADEPAHDARAWRVEQGENSVRSFERSYAAEAAEAIAALGARDATGIAAMLAARPAGERWRLTLARPLRAREPVVLHSARRLEPKARRWEVPLPSIIGARRMDGEVTLHLAGAEYVLVETAGLQEAAGTPPAPGRPRVGTPWRTFRYGDGLVSLTLSGRGASVDRATEALADQARLTTYAGDDGAARHYFTFRVSNWTQHTLPLRLPAGARPVAVRVGGHAVELPGLPESAEAGVLDVPVPRPGGASTADAPLRFEVIYDTASSGSAWLPWITLEAPAPVLPVPALTFRRTWRLPPGVDPIPDGRQRRIPGAGGALGESVPRALSERFLLSSTFPEGATQRPIATDQSEGLAAAAFGLRPKVGGRVLRIREMIAEMAHGFLGDRLVVDDAALREAGISDETLLAIEPADNRRDRAPPWESLGLEAVSAGPAVLLTTIARAGLWAKVDVPPDSVRTAVARAIANGHDESGRYRAASDWIRRATDPGREADPEALSDLGPALSPWTEWEPVAGVANDATLVGVRHSRVVASACVLIAVFLIGLCLRQRRAAWLWGWLTLTGLAALWLPSALRPLAWLPFLAASAAAIAAYVIVAARRANRNESASRGTRALVAATALAALMALDRGTGNAEAPPPANVYIYPTSDGDMVLAPPELLERLDVLSRADQLVERPVLLSASYDGKVVAGSAEFHAVFEAYSFTDGPAPLTLPLDGVYLDEGALVDGARSLPESVTAPRAAFAVILHGSGRHRIEVRFRAPPIDEEGSHGVQFAVPRVCQCRVRLELPLGASAPESLVNNGALRLTTDAGRTVLEVDPGRVATPLHFRWQEKGQSATTTTVREAYFCDLQAVAAVLTGLLDYRVSGGAISGLSVEIPGGWDVQAAQAKRVGPGAAPRLRDWKVTTTENGRVLEMELSSPTAGEFQIGLTLVPVAPLTREVTLLLPNPRGVSAGERGHVAYHVRGMTAVLESTRWLTGGPPAAFAPFWTGSTRPDLRNSSGTGAVYAATFRRESGQAPHLKLSLNPGPSRLRVHHNELKVRVFPHHAEVDAAFRIATPDGTPAETHCLLRPSTMTVSNVRGEGVRRWSQNGDKLLVWLQGEAQSGQQEPVNLEVSAWLPFDEPGGHLQIPSIHVESAEEAERAAVRFVLEPGLTLIPGSLDGLHSVPAPEPELHFVADRSDYRGVCDVRAGAAGATVRVLTAVEAREGRLSFRSTADFTVPRGDLRSVAVRLRNWEGEDVKLDVDKAVPQGQRERRRAANDRTWTLELRPGITGRLRLTLTGTISLEEAAAGVAMPEITAPGSSSTETLLVVAGAGLSTEGGDGLVATDWSQAAFKDWPADVARWRTSGAQAWRVARDDWSLRIRARSGPETGPVRVVLADHTTAVADGRHWLHEAVYWVRHGANTDLNIVLPKPGTVVAVAVDGIDVAPLQPEQRRLWLPLPGRPGVRAVRVRWRYDPAAESLEHPVLQTPVVEGAVGGPGVWTVYLPAEFEAIYGDAPAPRPGRARAAAAALYRAEGQLRICAALAEAGREGVLTSLAAAQMRFYSLSRQAEEALQLADDTSLETGPEGETLADWHRSLLAENRRMAKDHKFEDTRAEAEHRADVAGAAGRTVPEEMDPGALTGLGPARIRGPMPDNGTPAYLSLSDSIGMPALTLRPREEQRVRQALAASAVLLGLLFVAGTIALSPRLHRRLQPFWPEPLLLVGLVIWYSRGLSPAAALFVLLGAAGRALILGGGIRRLIGRRPPKTAIAGVASGTGSAS